MIAEKSTDPDMWKWNKTCPNNIPCIFSETNVMNTLISDETASFPDALCGKRTAWLPS